VDWGLDRHHSFGALEDLSQNNILLFMKALENAGCIGRTQHQEYPCVEITPHGGDVVRGRVQAMLDFSEILTKAPAKKSAPAPKPKPGAIRAEENSDFDHALFEKLRGLRKDMAEEKRVPPYRILHDSVLMELVRRTPSCVEDLMQIKGVGEAKIRTVLPKFMDAIRDWERGCF